MSVDAEVPGLMSVITRIGDQDVRYSVAFLADELQRSRSEVLELKAGQDNMISKLETLSNMLCKVQSPDGVQARMLWPVPPMMVAAGSSHSSPAVSLSSPHFCSTDSSSILSQSQSSSGGSGKVATSAGSGKVAKRPRGPDDSANGLRLQCPFCPESHWNEKSHVQHVDRAAERYAYLSNTYNWYLICVQGKTFLRFWVSSRRDVDGVNELRR